MRRGPRTFVKKKLCLPALSVSSDTQCNPFSFFITGFSGYRLYPYVYVSLGNTFICIRLFHVFPPIRHSLYCSMSQTCSDIMDPDGVSSPPTPPGGVRGAATTRPTESMALSSLSNWIPFASAFLYPYIPNRASFSNPQ